jgi:signal transduction histidine kinase
MLYEFIEQHRDEIREVARQRSIGRSGLRTDAELPASSVLFLDQVVVELRRDAGAASEPALRSIRDSAHNYGIAQHEQSRGVSDIVWDYGAICDAITSVASRSGATVAPDEFRLLNQLFDDAVSAALESFVGQSEEMRAAEQQVQRQEVAAFGHEIRSALHVAISAFRVMKRGSLTADSHTGHLLGTALERMRSLVQNSLTEVRLNVGGEPVKERIAVRDLFEEVAGLVELESGRRNVQVDIETDGVATVEGERRLLLSALSNLVQNGVKYTKSGGRVRVRAKIIGRDVVVEIADGCGGIPSDRIDQLFVPFKQMHSDRSGMGLGLFIARGVVRAHDGDISVRNEPGVGCVFSVRLPIDHGRAPSARAT